MKQVSLNSPQPVRVVVQSYAPIIVDKIAAYLRQKGIGIDGFLVEFDTPEEAERFKEEIRSAIGAQDVGFDDLNRTP